MALLEVQGASLRYRLDGPSDAPVLMLANSLGTTLEMWDGQVATFEHHFRVLRYDMRGHGSEALDAKPFDVERLARDALALLDALALSRVHFCGLSLGGVVGMWLGAHEPDRLHKLVLCNTAPTLGAPTLWNARITAVLHGGMAAVAPAVLERWFTAEFRKGEPAVAARMRQMFASISPAGYARACAAARNADQRVGVPSIRPSTLVVAGTHDQATPPSEGRWLAENIDGARYVELPTAHLSNIEATADFNRCVLEFLLARGEDDGRR